MSDNSAEDGSGEEKEEGNQTPSPKDDLGHLLHGLEEAAKHARSVLFVLITTSAFVVIAALSQQSESGTIKLPIAGNEIASNQFFFWSPLVLLGTYLYLQLYIQELKGRFERLQQFEQLTSISPSIRRDLLFPWFFVIALEARRQKHESQLFSSPEAPYVYPIAIVVVWLVGPIVLATLLFAFLREGKVIAIVPCICFLISSWVATRLIRSRQSRTEVVAGMLGGLALFIVTLAYVPELRERTYLATVWELRNTLAAAVSRWYVYLIAGLLIPATVVGTAAYGVYFLVAPIQRYRRRIASELCAPLRGAPEKESLISIFGTVRGGADTEIRASDFLNNADSTLILGRPGSGKTTLLRDLGCRIATKGGFKRRPIPIFIKLQRISRLLEHSSLAKVAQPPELSSKLYYKLIRKGRIVFLLDGLNWVRYADRHQVEDRIGSLELECHNCLIYLTSRLEDSYMVSTYFRTVFTLLPLRIWEIEEYLRKALQGKEVSPEEIFDLIRRVDSPGFCRTPLFLVALTNQIMVEEAIPRSTADLAERFIEQLLRWDESQSFGYDRPEIVRLLERMAHGIHESEAFTITREDARSIAQKETGTAFGDGNALLQAAVSSGLIREEFGGEALAFSNLAIQEYFFDRVRSPLYKHLTR